MRKEKSKSLKVQTPKRKGKSKSLTVQTPTQARKYPVLILRQKICNIATTSEQQRESFIQPQQVSKLISLKNALFTSSRQKIRPMRKEKSKSLKVQTPTRARKYPVLILRQEICNILNNALFTSFRQRMRKGKSKFRKVQTASKPTRARKYPVLIFQQEI
jgi:hypothetical protein